MILMNKTSYGNYGLGNSNTDTTTSIYNSKHKFTNKEALKRYYQNCTDQLGKLTLNKGLSDSLDVPNLKQLNCGNIKIEDDPISLPFLPLDHSLAQMMQPPYYQKPSRPGNTLS